MLASSPVAVGGVGGSGTRVVTQILLELGFYMGHDLNVACDNLWFTFLFKRPRWFAESVADNHQTVLKGFQLFDKLMTGRLSLSLDDLQFIFRAAVAAEQVRLPHRQKIAWVVRRLQKMSQARSIDYTKYIGWGWKEPNTHLYLRYLPQYFERPKYIHLLRHGLDMAYSKNKHQLDNWAAIFGLNSTYSAKTAPAAALKYWIKSNQNVMKLGEGLGAQFFLTLNFDELCASPKTEIEKLILFLELDIKQSELDYLCTIPKIPKSTGRYKQRSLDLFDATDLAAVRELGFTIEA